MSQYATPFLILNLGCEMIFVIAERLQAQNIPEDKTTLVLEDLITGLIYTLLRQDIMQPQPAYNYETVRDIMEKIANSSSMQLDAFSMNKLWELITMVFKWQLSMSSNLIEVTQRHLYGVETFVASEDTQLQLHKVQNTIESYNMILSQVEKQDLHECLLIWCKPFNVKVSLLLRMGLQDSDKNFITNNLNPISEKMLRNIGENIFCVSQNGRILENQSRSCTESVKSFDNQNVNELNSFVNEMLGERKQSVASSIEVTNVLQHSFSNLKLNNNPEDRFEKIHVNANDNNQLQSLIRDLNITDSSEHHTFTNDLFNMLETDNSEMV